MPTPKGHHAPADTITDLTRRNAELELRNQILFTQREQSQRRLAEATHLLGRVTTGLVTLDHNGLIDSINPAGAAILDADAAFLIKKPFGLFIPPQDQAVFYIQRSRIGKNGDRAPFEIQLKTPTERIRSVRIQGHPQQRPGQHLPNMLLVVEDITDYRQALEHLQTRTDLLNLVYSIMDDLVVWSINDIDDIIILCLEKLGLATGADRVHACFFHSRKTRFSVTHEWREQGTKPPALHNAPIEAILPIVRQLKKRQAISINRFRALSPIEQAPYNGFCASGTQSTLVAPLFYGRSILGIIGADAVRQPVVWSREHQRLLLLVGSGIVHALLRRQIENAPGTVRSRLFPFFDSSPATDTDSALMYNGPIEIVYDDDMAMASGIEWRFETDTGSHAHPVTLLRLTDGRFIHLACPTCHRHQQLDISEIRHLGSALKVTCVCDTVMHVKIELRRELRRSVNLDGLIVRKKTDWKGLTVNDWNKIHIINLSRHGIGFKLLGSLELGVNDRFEIKFNLNNRAESLIQKTAVVRSVHDAIVGCQFEGEHPCDANIAFYVLT